MTERNKIGKVTRGEILPPRSALLEMRETQSGVPLVNRIRYNMLKREYESYTGSRRALNEIWAALRDGERLQREFEIELKKTELLPIELAGVELKTLNEFQSLLDAEKTRDLARTHEKEDEEDRQQARKLKRLNSDFEIVQAEERLQKIRNPQKSEPRSPAEEKMANIARIRKQRDEMIAIVLNGRIETDLLDEDKRLLDDIRLDAEFEVKRALSGETN